MVVCADADESFNWLPESWGVTSYTTSGSEITEITQAGRDSGVFDGLTKEDMSGWSTSFHNYFTEWGDGFTVFERGWVGDVNSVVTIAATINPQGFPFTKEDDVADGNCRGPEEEIAYTICWENNSVYTFDDCYIIDFLPDGVNYPGAVYTLDPNTMEILPPDPNYNNEDHSYLWEIGTIEPNDYGCVELTVVVNNFAVPGFYLHNVAELWDSNSLLARDTEDTPVCCWYDDPNMVFVDYTAVGFNNGVSWENAYTDLADALERITNLPCSDGPFTIYVAQGTYDPNETAEMTFELPDNTSVYGGFKPGGCDFSQRNPKRYKTILTGLIDDDAIPDVDTIVTMGNDTLLDGFTVAHAAFLGHNIYGDGVDFTIENCTIKESYQYGIYARNGNATVKWCKVMLNDRDGIRHDGAGFTLTVENSWALRNSEYGIQCVKSTPTVKNSIISESDLSGFDRAGIRLYRPTYPPILHGNTISNNKAAGVYFTDDGDINNDPNNLDYPDMQNCIVYYNNPGGRQLAGFSADNIANFCCIQDCNEPGTTNYNDEPGFAYTVDPNGTPDPNNYHLAYDSFCKEKGNPSLSYTNQADVDDESRVVGSYVDIGADELYSCDGDYTEDDFYNALDWNADGAVNLHEFSKFSAAWLSYDPNNPLCDPNHPDFVSDPNAIDYISETDKQHFNGQCDLVEDLHINLADLAVFWDDWLWTACWRENYIAIYGTMSSSGESAILLDYVTAISVEPEPETSVDTLVQIIGFLDEVIAESPDNLENIEEIRAVLMDELKAVLE